MERSVSYLDFRQAPDGRGVEGGVLEGGLEVRVGGRSGWAPEYRAFFLSRPSFRLLQFPRYFVELRWTIEQSREPKCWVVKKTKRSEERKKRKARNLGGPGEGVLEREEGEEGGRRPAEGVRRRRDRRKGSGAVRQKNGSLL